MNTFDLLLALGVWCVKASIVFGLAWAVVRLFPHSSSTRRAIWILGFTGTVLALVLSASTTGLYSVEVKTGPVAAPAMESDQSLPTWLLLVWVAGVTVVLLNRLVGYIALRRAIRASALWQPETPGVANLLPHACEIRIASTPSLVAAMTWGWFRPGILLPEAAVTWDETRLKAVLLHELAHIKRGDSGFQVACGMVCALLWFNPTVWLAAAALRTDCESAADDAVIEAGFRRSDYAAVLLQTALEVNARKTRLLLPGVPFMRAGQLEKRISDLVRSPSRHRIKPTQTRIALAAVLLTGIGLGTVRTSAARGQFDFHKPSKEYMAGFRAGSNFSNGRSNRHLPEDAQTKMRIELEAQKLAGLTNP